MLGLLGWSEGRGVRVERTQLMGMPVLQVQLSPGGRWETHRVRRAARLLARQGVRRVLLPRNYDCREVLSARGLTGVDPMPLYRGIADRLVLAVLEGMGVEPQYACVALRGETVDTDLARTARLLCPRVRSLAIEVGWGGERLVRELYWEFGAAVRPEGKADAAVRFGGTAQGGEVVLCGSVPELLGLELGAPGLELPEELEPLPLITALWQAGRLEIEKLSVAPPINSLDIR